MELRTLAAALACALLLPVAADAAPATGTEANAGRLPPSLPVRRDPPSGDSLAWSPSLLVGALAAALGGGWVWSRRARHRRTGNAVASAAAIVRLSSHALTPQATVHAVQWGGEEYLLACTSQQVLLLSRRAGAATEDEA